MDLRAASALHAQEWVSASHRIDINVNIDWLPYAIMLKAENLQTV